MRPPPPMSPPTPPPPNEPRTERGRTGTGAGGGWTLDEVWLLANTTSWEELATQLEQRHPLVLSAIAIASTLLCCCTALCMCWLRVRYLRLSREYEERLRLFSAGQELSAFDADESAAVAAAVEVPSQFAKTLQVHDQHYKYDPEL